MHNRHKINPLQWLNIAPMLPEKRDEIVNDLLDMYRRDIITETAFIMSLVPEGNPVENKAAILGRRFEDFRMGTSSCDMPVGILLQATMGHGWAPNSKADFPFIVREDGTTPYQFCPMSEAFQQYVVSSVRQLATLKPAFFMVDDDFRLLTGRNGCYCELHLADFNRRTGKNYTRESLIAAIHDDGTVAHEYDTLLEESLVRLARLIREAIDEVDPTIPCEFCTCVDDIRHAPAIAKVLAGKSATTTIRINNARYLTDSLRSIPHSMLKTAVQIAAMPENCRILAEPDTFPHNQYSTAASTMHNLLTYSIFEGCRGGKLWLTRISVWEPASGKKYRDSLEQYSGFYKTIATMNVEWKGAVNLLPAQPYFNFPAPSQGSYPQTTWTTEVFGKMGIPFYFSKKQEGIICLTGAEARMQSDDTLQHLVQGALLLDGSAAIELCQRGFSSSIGVDAQPWKSQTVSFEKLNDGRDIPLSRSLKIAELHPNDARCEILSTLYHTNSGVSLEAIQLTPGATFYENKHGGKIVVMAIPVTPFGIDSFGMLDENRKAQLLVMLDMLGMIPFYYLGTEEVILKTGYNKAEGVLLMINIGMDDIDSIRLGHHCSKIVAIDMLLPNGHWQPVSFELTKDQILIRHELRPQQSAVFRLLN